MTCLSLLSHNKQSIELKYMYQRLVYHFPQCERQASNCFLGKIYKGSFEDENIMKIS
jgi:hypothetical protein